MKLKYSNLVFKPKEINEEQRTIRAVFSTGDIDRHGEVVDQKSWLLDDFMKNPVVLFGHDHGQPPVGMITGLGYNSDGNLEGEVKFAADEYPFAKVIWNLYKGGYMKAFSVGFSSARVDIVDDQVILRDNTLYEISTVSVPANAMALAKSKGMNVEPLEVKLATELAKALNMSLKGGEEEVAEEEEETTEVVETEETTKAKCEKCQADVEDSAKGCPCKDKPAEEAAPAEAAQETPAEEGPADTEEETTEEKSEPSVALEKAADAIIESVKEGRVLSKANRSKVQSAVDALQALLDADSKEDKTVRANNTAISIKVETPAVRIAVPAKGPNKAKLINQAVRALLAEKRR